MAEDWNGMQTGAPRKDVETRVTQLGLEYHLMTQFTSFVAVEERTVVGDGGTPKVVQVPVELPQGVSGKYLSNTEVVVNGAGGNAYALSAQYGRAAGYVAPPPPPSSGCNNCEMEVTVEATAPLVEDSTSQVSSTYNVGQMNGSSYSIPSAGPSRLKRTETVEVKADSPLVESSTSSIMSAQRRDFMNGLGIIFESGDEKDSELESQAAALLGKIEENQDKLHPALLVEAECWLDPSRKHSSCSKTDKGRVSVQLWLTEDTPQVRKKLAAAGLELEDSPPHGKTAQLAGAIKLKDLAKLLQLSEVTLAALNR
jgi:hypothetical protein